MVEEPEITVCIKVIPDAEPNAEGVWQKVIVRGRGSRIISGAELRASPLEKRLMWKMLKSLAGDGHHAVALTLDLGFDGKRGNYSG